MRFLRHFPQSLTGEGHVAFNVQSRCSKVFPSGKVTSSVAEAKFYCDTKLPGQEKSTIANPSVRQQLSTLCKSKCERVAIRISSPASAFFALRETAEEN